MNQKKFNHFKKENNKILIFIERIIKIKIKIKIKTIMKESKINVKNKKEDKTIDICEYIINTKVITQGKRLFI